MSKRNILIAAFLSLFLSTAAQAQAKKTARVPQFSNDVVNVWETTIYPSKGETLPMHRHENNRVLVPFDSGKLKITNSKGEVHYLDLEKDKAVFLEKNVPGESHNDENMSDHPIRTLVIELKK